MAKYFTLNQCLYSNTAIKKGIRNIPGKDIPFPIDGFEIKDNINNVMKYCVNPIKDEYPGIIITSVYRSAALNQAIGGSPTSQHCFGMAADIQDTDGISTAELFNWIIDNVDTWDQVIWEFPERGSKSWVHISYDKNRNRKRTTLASKSNALHKRYAGGTWPGKTYQQEIKRAYPEYLSNI